MTTVDVSGWSDAVDQDRLMAHTAAIAQYVRLSGSEDERKAFTYIAEQLESFGLATRWHTPTCLVSLPRSGALTIGGDAVEPCITHAFGTTTADGGVSGEVVYAGRGGLDDLRRVNATGKLALTDGLATPEKARAASIVGALGVISISGEQLHEMIVSPVWGSPTLETLNDLPTVPLVSITTAAGATLREHLSAGPLTATLTATVDTSWQPLPLLLGDLDVDVPDPTTGQERDYVMFSGHVDSWHYGAMDNGSANATMLETARILAEQRGSLRRGVRFAFWSGHSHARYATSAWFADRYWHELAERCVTHVNVDSTGGMNATLLEEANTVPETHALARAIIQRQTGQELVYKRFGRAGDQSFWGVGLSSMFMSLSQQGEPDAVSADQAFLLGGGGSPARGGGLGWWWHTTEDTLDKVDPAFLTRDTKVYVEVVGHLATAAWLGLDIAAAVADLQAQVTQCAAEWAGALAGGDDDDLGFDALDADLAALSTSAERLLAGAATADDAQQAALSRQVVAALRPLTRVNFTHGGAFAHDPALNQPPLPALRAPQGLNEERESERWAAQHGVRRAINGVRQAVREAAAALQTA